MTSVIVPVYRAEGVIGRCVESVMRQTLTEWELILVDDGSPDGSGAICDELAKRDSRIKVMHKANGGASSARNAGLDIAKGEWIVFVDADDTLSQDFLKNIAENQSHDFLAFGMAVDRYYPDCHLAESSTRMISIPYAIDCAQIKDSFACIFRSLNMDSSCAKAYRKEIIDRHNLRFNTDMICYEDFDFVIRYLANCKGSFCSLPYIAYHYIQPVDYNPIARRNNSDLLPSILTVIKSIHNWIRPENLDGDNKDAYYYLISGKFGFALEQLKGKKRSDVMSGLKAISNDEIFKEHKGEIISHSPFFKRTTLRLNTALLRPLAYLSHRYGK